MLPLLSAIAQKLPRPFRQPPRYLCRWMVSDLYYNRPDLVSPRWTPDGKNVSFEYKGALYLMPVN